MNDALIEGLVSALAPTFAVIVSAMISWVAAHRAAKKLASATEKIAEVHTIVNSQRTEMMAQIDFLKAQIADMRAISASKPPEIPH